MSQVSCFDLGALFLFSCPDERLVIFRKKITVGCKLFRTPKCSFEK